MLEMQHVWLFAFDYSISAYYTIHKTQIRSSLAWGNASQQGLGALTLLSEASMLGLKRHGLALALFTAHFAEFVCWILEPGCEATGHFRKHGLVAYARISSSCSLQARNNVGLGLLCFLRSSLPFPLSSFPFLFLFLVIFLFLLLLLLVLLRLRLLLLLLLFLLLLLLPSPSPSLSVLSFLPVCFP